MSNYPSSSGYGQTQNAQPGFAPPQISAGLPTLPPGGQMNYLPQSQMGYPQGGQTGFSSQGQMGYPPQGIAPPGFGNTNSYPTSAGGFLSPPTYGTPNCNLVGGGGPLGPNSGASPINSQSAGAPNPYHPCSAPPNTYPQMANNPNAGPYAPSPYPPQGSFPCKLLTQSIEQIRLNPLD